MKQHIVIGQAREGMEMEAGQSPVFLCCDGAGDNYLLTYNEAVKLVGTLRESFGRTYTYTIMTTSPVAG